MLIQAHVTAVKNPMRYILRQESHDTGADRKIDRDAVMISDIALLNRVHVAAGMIHTRILTARTMITGKTPC